MTFETERLILRPWQEEDAKDLYASAKDPLVGPAAGWPAHISEEDSLNIIRTVLSKPETYAICLKGNGKPIGSIGLFTPSHVTEGIRPGDLEVGYWVGRNVWGRGYVPEAVRRLQSHAFEELHCERLWCCYFEGNEKSRRCMDKCGFLPHHREENIAVPQVNKVFTGNIAVLPRDRWESLKQIGQRPIAIETPRLTLCMASPAELLQMIDEESDPELKQAYREMQEGCQKHPEDYPFHAPWKILLKEGDFIGDLCFKGLTPDQTVEIGYGLKPDFEGKGYMTEAVQAAVNWALRQKNVLSVIAEAAQSNAASAGVLTKAGFLPTGKSGKEGLIYRCNGSSSALLPEIVNRRSVRKYKPDPVSHADLLLLLEAARLSASGNNKQPWRFVVIEDEETKRRITSVDHEQEWMMTAPVFIACLADLRSQEEPSGEELLEETPSWNLKRCIRDSAISITQIMLQAEHMGLGTCWTGWYDMHEMRKVLGVEPYIWVSGILTVGYPAKIPQERPKMSVSEIARFAEKKA